MLDLRNRPQRSPRCPSLHRPSSLLEFLFSKHRIKPQHMMFLQCTVVIQIEAVDGCSCDTAPKTYRLESVPFFDLRLGCGS